MASNMDTIYLKADRNVEVTKPEVTLGDVLSIECANSSIASRVKTMKLFQFHHTRNKEQNRVAVSILRVIACIHEVYPDTEIQSVGEQDFIVTYEQQKSSNSFFHCLKVIAVILITFCGAAFSIMAFNNDVDVTKLFGQIYELVTGTKSDGYTILEFTYCVGIVIGILIFFNHFGKKKFTVDPTPMEVEMRLYENDIQKTLIENYARKEKELDVRTADHTGDSRV